MSLTLEELRQELEEGRVRPAYLLAGSEDLLRDDALAALREAVLRGSSPDFNLDRLEGEEASAGALRDALRTLPVGAPRRLVWLREPGGRRGGAKALLDALPAVVQELGAEAPATLVVTARSADGRTAWVRAFRDPAAQVVCEPPRGGRALHAFVAAEARRQGLALGPGAAEALAERVGPQLLCIRSELEKASLLAGQGSTVSARHVVEAVSDLAEEPVWELTDAIGDGRAGDALAVLAKLRASGAPAPVLLASLAGHFRRLVRVRFGGRVPVPPFVARKLDSQARRYAPARLLQGLRAIHDTDELLKGRGSLAPDLALERLVLGLAS